MHAPALTLDALICLSEAIGARRMDLPETYGWRAARIGVEEIMDELDAAFQWPVAIPNPFPSEYGLVSSRGVISYRVPQALYQAWRIAQLVHGVRNAKVLEIGGGLGRTAFYAKRFGIMDYTIVDIPVSSLAQGNFLGRVLGEAQIHVDGEPVSELTRESVKLISPRTFFEGNDRYDLIVNVDSLTEVGDQVAQNYWEAIQERTITFLSINHETNAFTVADLIRSSSKVVSATRTPYWMRRGYIEELVRMASSVNGVNAPGPLFGASSDSHLPTPL